MLKFKNVHVYCNQTNTLDFNFIVGELQKYFTGIKIDIRPPFLIDIDNLLTEQLVSIIISDVKKPFKEQPRVKVHGELDQSVAYEKNFARYLILNGTSSDSSTEKQYKELILYDGFMMQRLFEAMINENEANTDHVHIVFEDRLICTFSEEDWRYHARTILGGSPSIISTTGIIEAPAKPKEWYIRQMQKAAYGICSDDDKITSNLSSNWKKKYLDYGDYRINFAAVGYALQALFFFITEGNPFCNDINCRLYNAHWQEELIYSQIQSMRLCNEHADLLHEFNTVCC